MYRSTDAQGKPVAMTGTYIEPDVPWPGNGPRPLLAYATAPYGMGEQCAPSKLFNQGIRASLDTGFDLMFNIEEGFIATLLARGFAIVITDGVGLGVHGPMAPQFLNRLAGGTAVLDAARAAMRLPGTSLNPHGPVAFWAGSPVDILHWQQPSLPRRTRPNSTLSERMPMPHRPICSRC
jgi:Secretory lipase